MNKALLVSILLSTNVYAAQSTINDIEAAAMQLASEQLTEIESRTQGYDQALSQYRLSVTYNVIGEQQKAKTALNQAIENLEKITEQQPNDDEAWALLSQTYGFNIALNPIKAPYFGPKAHLALEKALTINPDNPRAHLVKGVSAFNTPSLFGGSKSQAIKSLNQAIDLFQHDIESGFHWGQAETYVWRGLSHMELNKPEQAKHDWQQALSIAPDYGWAKMLLTKAQ